MASKTLQFKYTPGYTSLAINVYPLAGGNNLNLSGPIPAAVNGTNPSLYEAIMTDLASGTVNVDILDTTKTPNIIGSGVCDLLEVVGYYQIIEGPTPLQIAASVASVTTPPISPIRPS